MPNIATILKEEIIRLVRKELKAENAVLRKSNSRYRSEIAELKRRLQALEQKLKTSERLNRKPTDKTELGVGGIEKLRFRAAGLKKPRERLGVSASVLASILGVSPQTIFNWEAGSSKPGKDQVAKIAILRKMGKREFQSRLLAMKG